MENKGIALLIGLLSGLLGYYTYTVADALSGALVVFASAWLMYRLSSAKKVWDTLGFLQNPPIAAAIFFFLGFMFFALRGGFFEVSLTMATGIGLLGAVAGMMFYSYWNIAG